MANLLERKTKGALNGKNRTKSLIDFTQMSFDEARKMGFKFATTVMQSVLKNRTEGDPDFGKPLFEEDGITQKLSKLYIRVSEPAEIALLDGNDKPVAFAVSLNANAALQAVVGKKLDNSRFQLNYWEGKDKTTGEEGTIYTIVLRDEELT